MMLSTMTPARRTLLARTLMLCVAAFTVSIVLSGAAMAQASLFGGPRPPEVTGFARWIIEQQAAFYRALAAAIRTARTDGSAKWSLMGISFIYGVFHAAGPGHGKAVISSYLVANRETFRRGIVLSFASALLQATTAIAVVAVGAILLGATGKAMSDTVRVIEIASYSLIVLLGARLIWVKGAGFVRAFRRIRHTDHEPEQHSAGCGCGHKPQGKFRCDAHDHDHHHDHDHDLDALPWGHAHGPEPQELAGPGGWKRGLSTIIGVGLRPCSGAILVLVFALSQGLFWSGVASTFMMGLGTAITVALAATLAVTAKSVVARFAGHGDGYGVLVMRGMEVLAAVGVLVFGVALLLGYMASERMAGF